MKKYYLLATALAAMVSCTSDDYVGDNNLQEANGQAAISFNMNTPAVTRARTGSDAAGDLSNQFIVWGEKNETAENKATAAGTTETARSGDLVFPNYQVNWVALPHSTTSNSDGWEYVGYTHTSNYQSHITPNKTVDQTIKYWDMAATSYVFTAVSAKPDDITDGKVSITKTTSDATSVYNKGYSVAVTDAADLTKLYFSDRVDMAPGTNPVTLTFRNSISQVRVGMYETVPGYDVKVTKFYYAASHAGSTPAFSDMTSVNTANFVADVPNVSPASGKTSVAGTFAVKYFPQSTENDDAGITNHPTVTFTPTTPATDSKITLSLGNGVYNTKLNETSATPTYDNSGDFTTVFPQENNSTNLKLKIDYQLYNTTTGETINLTAKTAEIPAQYLQWKPNYKYTYIFKITDNDLTPITFDAAVIQAEDGNVEYITTVTEPSITTYAKASNVITDDEYLSGSNIYVTVMEGSTVKTLTVDDNAKLYTASAQTGYVAGITEASVANALAHGTQDPTGTWTVTDAGGKTLTVTTAAGLSAFTEIAATDSPTGETLTINGAKFSVDEPTFNPVADGASVKKDEVYYTANDGSTKETVAADGTAAADQYWTKTSAAGYYVFEYKKPAVQATGTYVAGTKYYTDNTCATEVDTTSFEAGVTDVSSYFLAPATKYYKVIKVVDKY